MSTVAGPVEVNRLSNNTVWESYLVCLAAILPLSWGLSSGFLAFDNDTLYADVARTMVDTGNWMMPAIHGVPFLDKPPLFFWLTALSIELLGDTTIAYRLPAALSAAGTAGLMYFILRRIETPRSVSIAAIIALLAASFDILVERTWRSLSLEPSSRPCTISVVPWKMKRRARVVGCGPLDGPGTMLKSLVGLLVPLDSVR